MLQVKELIAGYRDTPVLNGVNIELQPGQVVAVLGPNGAGKSTLFKALIGLLKIETGTILLDDRDITRLPTHLRVTHGLAYVPQLQRVFATLNLQENLRMGAFTVTGDLHARMDQVLSLFPDLGPSPK